MNMTHALFAIISATLCLAAPEARTMAQTPAPDLADRCSALNGLAFSRGVIGLPTSGAKITGARLSTSSDDPAGLCVVQGSIAPINPTSPPIHFQVNLPQDWNRKAVQIGGGGYDGFLQTGRNPNFLPTDPNRLGYATYGSDSGHTGGDGTPGSSTFDASFAMDAEARENYAYAQIKKTHDAAFAVLRQYYGGAPYRSYFYGNSQGGHEALLAAYRFPDDYDGVVAIHPAYNIVALQLGGLAMSKSLYRTPQSWLSLQDLKALGAAVLKRCDDLDGLKDGVIANLAQCRKVFRVEQLACKPTGPNPANCLTAPQIRAVKEMAEPADFGLTIDSASRFGGWPILDGAFTYATPFGLGTRPSPRSPPDWNDSFAFLMADQGVRYLIMQDPALRSLDFVPARNKESVLRAAALIDVTDANFDRFKARGGKILLMHGSVDMAIPLENSIGLFNRLSQRYGPTLDGLARFYVAFGFGHGDGAFQARWDSLAELDRWVESGKAPGPQVIRDTSKEHAGRSMPLCQYPMWPRYNGHGDPRLASNFQCTGMRVSEIPGQ